MFDETEVIPVPDVKQTAEVEGREKLQIAGVLNIYRPFSFLDQKTLNVAIQGEVVDEQAYRKEEYHYILAEGTYDVLLSLDDTIVVKTVEINSLKATEITVKLSGFGKFLQFTMKTALWLFILSLMLLIVSFFFRLPMQVPPQLSSVLLIIFFISLQVRKKVNYYQVDVSQRNVARGDYERAEVVQCQPTESEFKLVYAPMLYEHTIWRLYKKHVQLLQQNAFSRVVRTIILTFALITSLGVATYFFQEKMMIVDLLLGILLLILYEYDWKLLFQLSLGLTFFVLTLLPGPFSLILIALMILYLFPAILGLRDNYVFSKIQSGQGVSEQTENRYANVIKHTRDQKHKNYAELYINSQYIHIISKKRSGKLYFRDLTDMTEIESACLLSFSKGYYFENNTRLPGFVVNRPYLILNMQDTFANSDVSMTHVIGYIKRHLEENLHENTQE